MCSIVFAFSRYVGQNKPDDCKGNVYIDVDDNSGSITREGSGNTKSIPNTKSLLEYYHTEHATTDTNIKRDLMMNEFKDQIGNKNW